MSHHGIHGPARSAVRSKAFLGAAGFATALGSLALAQTPVVSDGRADTQRKGSVLIYSVVEIKWNAAGMVTQDTFITLTNDFTDEARVQFYFVNGDPPAAAVIEGVPPRLIERVHPGWNVVDTQFTLTKDQSTYWSVLTGQPAGVPSFTQLDPGNPPGRPDPDPDNAGGRMLRGYLIGWAVDHFGHEIRWNHLTGGAIVVDYARTAAWEYPAWTFAARGAAHGDEPESCLVFNLESGQCVDSEIIPGRIDLDGYEYDNCPGKLMFAFNTVGSVLANGAPGVPNVGVDTNLVLFTCSADLRQDTEGPVTTKAKFDIWNENEIRFSGTERCLTCWDMTPLASYTDAAVVNHFLMTIIQTATGKARVSGLRSTVCDQDGISQDAALLGVVQQVLRFPGELEKTAAPLIGQGDQVGRVLYDIIEPPQESTGGDSH